MPLVSKDYRWTAVFASKAMLLANILLEGCVSSEWKLLRPPLKGSEFN